MALNKLSYLLIVIMCFAFTHSSDQMRSYEGFRLYELTPKSRVALNMLHSLSLSDQMDFWNLPRALDQKAHVMVRSIFEGTFTFLMANYNISSKVLIKDLESTFQRERYDLQSYRAKNRAMTFTSYAQMNEINSYLFDLAKRYPNLVQVDSAGKSYENRDINIIKISNRSSLSKKISIFVDAGIHAREWIAPATALYIVHELVENFVNNADLLRGIEWIILPVVNPDGYEYSHTKDRLWRKTRRPNRNGCIGTDGNRNFDFHWGEVGTSANYCSDIYKGDKAFSEPETLVVRKIMDSIKGTCKFYLTLHSYGNYLLYPWGYTEHLPSNWRDLDEIARTAADAIRQNTGTKYLVGSSTNVLYAAAGGSDDYALAVKNIPIAITMELPGGGVAGFDPPAGRIRTIVKESWIGIKAMALRVNEKYGQPYYHIP